jgi:hypothetical protein
VSTTAAPVIEYDAAALKERLTVKSGQSLILTVNILGVPTPKSAWCIDGTELKAGGDVGIEGDGTFSRLTVKNTTSKNSGRYTITAENDIGSASADFDCVVQGSFSSQQQRMNNENQTFHLSFLFRLIHISSSVSGKRVE